MTFNFDNFNLHLGNIFVKDYAISYLEGEYSFEIYDDGTGDIYYILENEGIDYLFRDNENRLRLKAIFIYLNNKKDGYKSFSKKLPFNIENVFKKKEINILFGNADKQIEEIPIIGKDFSEIYIKTGYSIGIEYCKNNKIKFIRIEV